MTKHISMTLLISIVSMILIAGLPSMIQASEINGRKAQAKTIERLAPDERTVEQSLILAKQHYADNRIDAAGNEAAKILEKQPSHVEAWLIHGDVAKSKGDWKAALNAYQHAVNLAPRNPSAEIRRGQALQELGRAQEADASFARYRALVPAP